MFEPFYIVGMERIPSAEVEIVVVCNDRIVVAVTACQILFQRNTRMASIGRTDDKDAHGIRDEDGIKDEIVNYTEVAHRMGRQRDPVVFIGEEMLKLHLRGIT